MDRLEVEPLGDRIVVEQNEAKEVTAGGIVLPNQAREKPAQGKCLAVGLGRILESGNRSPMSVKVGDEVLYGKYTGTEIEFNGKKYTILNEGDILVIVKC